MTPKEKLDIDRMSKVAESQGWSVTAIETRGEFIEITIAKPKTAIERMG